jgi:hypothetical protein
MIESRTFMDGYTLYLSILAVKENPDLTTTPIIMRRHSCVSQQQPEQKVTSPRKRYRSSCHTECSLKKMRNPRIKCLFNARNT